ncbi:hypothetical protein QTO34_010619 [Cnephaeus nilssonii]|uniref:L1 transposable element RRM domain-containing protein n=1 Tax=Cnephaeus nilssonii TaxID=3371016 RepID=A0AA40HFQ2_CNENI|nr:hypothetical protein QTO34_010619 [Eptesicus nilssonii]
MSSFTAKTKTKKTKVGDLGACLLGHQAFQKPPPSRRLLKGLVHQRTGTQLHREKRKRVGDPTQIDLQGQEVQRTPNKRNPKRTTPRHNIIKMPRAKDKERVLKAAREKQLVTYKGAPIRLSADFSTETMQALPKPVRLSG